MSIYNITEMEAMIRSALNEPSQSRITSAEILRVLNDGQKDVAIKALCIEKEVSVSLQTGQTVVPFDGIRVNFVGVGSILMHITADESLTFPAISSVTGSASVLSPTPLASLGTLSVPGVPTLAVSAVVV